MSPVVKAAKVVSDHFARTTNIAIMVIALSFAFMFAVYFYPPSEKIDLSFGQIFKEFIGLIGIALGYIFGRSKSN